MRLMVVLAAFAALVLAGCGSEQAAETTTVDAGDVAVGQEASSQPADLALLQEEYEAAKAAYDLQPDDAGLRDQYVAATVIYGHESMMSPDLEARVKYRQALRLYREALELDPDNEVAKAESAMIVEIYEQMGRPVPED
jgi:tetratricopeptide (TPR) repeat protein